MLATVGTQENVPAEFNISRDAVGGYHEDLELYSNIKYTIECLFKNLIKILGLQKHIVCREYF